MYIVGGVKGSFLRKLRERGEAVGEFISHLSVRAFMNTDGLVFLTEDLFEEIGPGTRGVIAEVREREISFVRIHFDHIDEKEIERARVRLVYKGEGILKEVRLSDRLPVARSFQQSPLVV